MVVEFSSPEVICAASADAAFGSPQDRRPPAHQLLRLVAFEECPFNRHQIQNRTELEKSACCSLGSPKDVRRVLEFSSAQTRFA